MLPQSQLPKCHLTPIPHGLRRALRSLADFDHIVDSDEMIVHPLATVETGGARLDQNSLPAGLVRRRELLNGSIKVGLHRVIFHTTILRKFSPRVLLA